MTTGFRRFALCVLIATSCSDSSSTVTSQLNLDRPVDIAFACYGGLRLTGGSAATTDQDIIQTAQPLQACDIRSAETPSCLVSDPNACPVGSTCTPSATDPSSGTCSKPIPPGQEVLGSGSSTKDPGSSAYYGFILQSEPGTVALAKFDTKAPSLFVAGGDVVVLDTDPLIPGKNGIAVGVNPVAIASDSLGCYELTANAGSCDLSALEVNSAIDVATDNVGAVAKGEHVKVDRITVTNASGQPIRARPAAMVGEPPTGTIGNACPATPTGLIYVAYPGCHLVAGIDASTGMIVNGIQYAANGTATITDGNVTCPDECGGGGVVAAGPRPVALNLKLDDRTNRRALAIGSQNTNVVTIVDLDITDRPATLFNAVLEQNRTNDLGVTAVALSPTIGMGGVDGFLNDDSALGGQFQFVYAIGTDNTVRVANISAPPYTECDTQIDPRFLHAESDVKLLSCMPLDPTRRRAGARSPGIQLTGDNDPTSIEIFRVPQVSTDQRETGLPARVIGYFGIITASNGATYVLNVDNDDYADFVDPGAPVGTQIPLDIAHQLRDAVPHRTKISQAPDADGIEHTICDTEGVDPDSSGAPDEGTRYANGATTRTIPAGQYATEKVFNLPSIRQVLCTGQDDTRPVSELSYAAPQDVRDQEFPDLFGLPFYDETWTMTYEGSLSIDTSDTANSGPAVRTSVMYIDADGIRLTDQTAPFCAAGVEPYDIVQLRGCDPAVGDSDCPIGYTCFVHPESSVANLGACELKGEADRLANACKEFLVSLRKYTVGKTTSGELKLIPRKHVLQTTPVDGCTSDAQCKTLADYRLQNQSASHPSASMVAADTHSYTCAVDTARAPELDGVGAPLKRCIETCQADSDCDTGTVCDHGMCMEGVIPPQSCVNAPQRYELRASEAFAVLGTRSGYHHATIADANNNCIRDPKASRYDIGRIPLRAPACDPTADPYTGKHTDGTFDPNPCSTTVDHTEDQTNYVAGSCVVGSPATNLTTRQAAAIRFRGPGMTLTLVDPTYPGDASCIGDRAGGLGNIPIVPPLYQSSVRIVSGFRPLLISTGAAYPVKVRRGPGESIWIMDDGDYLSTSISVASTRGKVFRVESQYLGVINTLQ